MVINWSKDGNSSLEVKFDKFNFWNLFRIQTTHPRKGIDSYFERSVWVFGFKFTYINVNYDDIVFIKLKPEDNYTSDKNSHKIKVFKETLNHIVNTNTYYDKKLPFNWNYFIKEDGGIIYFITGRKKFFMDEGLDAFVNRLREITWNDNDSIYFPKYNPFQTDKINRIFTYTECEEEYDEEE